jgi:hypothetical protein
MHKQKSQKHVFLMHQKKSRKSYAGSMQKAEINILKQNAICWIMLHKESPQTGIA